MLSLRYIATGAVIGDSVGAQYEFRYNKNREYKFGFFYESRIINQWQGEKKAAKGQWTDDTEMAYSNYAALKENDFEYNRNSAILKYIEWANSKPFGVGNNTGKLFKGIKTIVGYDKRYEKYMTDSIQSNGSLMRAWPLVMAKNPERAAEMDAIVTNSSELNRYCNILYIRILKSFMENKFEPSVVESMKGFNKELDLLVEEAKDYAQNGIIKRKFEDKQDGWVAHAMFFAVYAALVNLPPLKIYNNIISKKIDPDTTGAIAGAVIGARFREKLLNDSSVISVVRQIFQCDTTKGDYPRPNKYHPKIIINTMRT